MNIFVLSSNPGRAARMQCDQHVVKMPLETAQMLCAAFPPGDAPYRRTHEHHPCTIWAHRSLGNYLWLLEHGLALSREYEFRYGRMHRSQAVIEWCRDCVGGLDFPGVERTPFVCAMPARFRRRTPVGSYRALYLLDKSRFARWTKGRKPPFWYRRGLAEGGR